MKIPDQHSLDDLELMNELFEMGVDFAPSDRSIKALSEQHKKLVKNLQKFERESSICLISALETIPALHAYTFRIQVLLHLAVNCCKGTRQARPDDLKLWMGFMDSSQICTEEDPNEDVFIGYVCTPRGGFRVYLGIFSHADFMLERLLYFLSEKSNAPGFLEAFSAVIELLRVSDAITNELGQVRYSTSTYQTTDTIPVALDEILICHSQAIAFNSVRLSNLGIDYAKLECFHFTPERAVDFDSKPLLGSALEHYPLITCDDGFIVASPASLCRAAIIRILQATSAASTWVDSFFGIENANFFANEILFSRLSIEKANAIKLPKLPESLSAFFPMVGQFDYGMPVIAMLRCSSLAETSDLEAIEEFTIQQTEDFTQYIACCCKACETVEGFRGGLVLVALAGVGRPLIFGFGAVRPNWYFFSSSLADWHTLASDNEFEAKRLWYLGLQQDLAEKSNLKLFNPAGLLNLYGFWKDNNFSLIHKSFDPKNTNNMMVIDGSYSLRVNSWNKSANDRHCRQSIDGSEWITLQRQWPRLNPDLSANLMYVDHATAGKGLLRACVVYEDCAWWVELKNSPLTASASNLLFRLWDCVFNWVELILPTVRATYPHQQLRNISIQLEFPGVEKWKVSEVTQQRGDFADLTFSADPYLSTIRLIFTEGILGKFYRPDNLAEREIVAAIIETAAIVNSISTNRIEIQQLVDFITKNKNTRFFHLVRSSTLEAAVSHAERAKPCYVPMEEISRVHMGIAFRAVSAPPSQITNQVEAKKFLDEIVANLQGAICSRLKQLQISPIVSHSFHQLDELSRDGMRWSLSTRSLLALADNAEWLYDRLRTESGRLALAEITNRVLIETSVYSNESKATEHISQTEHATLLAQLAVMIELANHRDAIVGGFVTADIKIHPNGMVEYDESFEQQVFQPYLASRIDDRIQLHADNYENNFEPSVHSTPSSDEENPKIVAFENAFHAEYGFPLVAIDKIIYFFDELAIAKGRTGGTMNSIVLRSILEDKVGLNARQIETFYDRFVLPIRPNWNRNFPKGCEVNDVLPWRFFRALSVLVRPFIEVSRSPRNFAVSASHLHRWRRYLSNAIFDGHLPARLFQTTEMHRYLGSIADKNGHDFTKEVASILETILTGQRVEIKLTELGAPANPDLGDIDVVAWDSQTRFVFLIECKRLKTVLTVSQVVQQLEDFRGDLAEMDSLAKHQRRFAWCKANPKALSQITGIPENEIQWVPLLVTSGRVPMSFVDAINFSKDQVIPAQDLKNLVSTLLSNGELIKQ